jgi:hypothetical protein
MDGRKQLENMFRNGKNPSEQLPKARMLLADR